MSSFLDDVVAIDMHTHATVSTRTPPDEVAIAMDAAMDAYFKQPMPRPTIAETAAYSRERRMLAVIRILHNPKLHLHALILKLLKRRYGPKYLGQNLKLWLKLAVHPTAHLSHC